MQGFVKDIARLGRRWFGGKFRPDAERDIFLMTYPRSGTSWLSCIATELLYHRSPQSLTEIISLVPDAHVLMRESKVPLASRYLIKSHFQFNSAPFGPYRRVIYLIRDPHEVLFSYYRYECFVSHYSGNLKQFATDWSAGRIWPCSWQEHVNSWLAPQVPPSSFELTLLRYEDFVTDPVGQTEIFAKLLGVEAERSRIEQIVADTSFDAMRAREIRGNSGYGPEFNFIGRPKPSNWKEHLSRDEREAIAIVEQFAYDTMQRVGYPSFASAPIRLVKSCT